MKWGSNPMINPGLGEPEKSPEGSLQTCPSSQDHHSIGGFKRIQMFCFGPSPLKYFKKVSDQHKITSQDQAAGLACKKGVKMAFNERGNHAPMPITSDECPRCGYRRGLRQESKDGKVWTMGCMNPDCPKGPKPKDQWS